MRRRFVLVCVVAMVALPMAGPAHSLTCDGSLTAAPQPTVLNGGPSIVGSSAQAGRWALGQRTEFGSVTKQAAISEHWDGTRWVKVQMAYARAFEPKALVVLGGRIWAAGRHSDPSTGGGDAGSAIERWNGSTWRRATNVPAVMNATSTSVWAIDGSSRRDVWAGGATIVNDAWRMVMLHWDGRAWTRVPAPLPLPVDAFDGDLRLTAIAASAPDDVWAVGFAFPFGQQSFAMHWDGSRWSVVNPSVPDAPDNNSLNDVAARGGEIWAVGRAEGAPLILRRGGTGWVRMPSPDTGFTTNRIDTISIGSAILIAGSGYSGFPPNPSLEYYRWSPPNTWVALSAPVDGIGDLVVGTDGEILAAGGSLGESLQVFDGCL